MRHTTIALLATLLLAGAAVGCGSSSDDKPTPTATVTATKTPELSAAETKKACVDAWLAVMTADDYDPDAGFDAQPGVCKELPGQAAMYAEALRARNQANRDELQRQIDEASAAAQP